MISGLEYDPEKTDLWSAGVTLFNMLTGHLPFIDRNIKDLYKKIVDGSVDYPAFISREAADLLQGILKTSPKARFTFRDVFAHPWMQRHKPGGYPIALVTEKVGAAHQCDTDAMHRVARCLNVSKQIVFKSLVHQKKNGFTAQ